MAGTAQKDVGQPEPAGPGRLHLIRLALVALVLPWLPVVLSVTRNGVSLYLAGVALVVALMWILWRFSAFAPKWVEGLDLLAWNLVSIFLLMEIGTRVYLAVGNPPAWMVARPDQFAYRLDPTREWLGRLPNAQGFYDEEFRADRAPGVTRVVAVGDSYLVGLVPYPENYVTMVDEALGDEVELLNLGVVHMAPRQYLEILLSDGLQLDPDVVILSVYVGNDIRADPPRGLFSYWGSSAVTIARRAIPVLGASRYGNHTPSGRLFEQAPDGTRVELPQMPEENYLGQELRHVRRLLRPPTGEHMRVAWRDTERAIAELVEVCRARGIAVLATIAPDEVQISPRLFERVVEFGGLDESEFDLEYPIERLKKGFEALGVPVLDMAPALREAEKRASTYHLRGTHWNRAGNAAVAELVTPWLSSRLREIAARQRSGREH